MATNSFEKDNFGWRLQQLQQRLGEWWELQLRKLNFDQSKNPLGSWESWSWLWEIIQILLIILIIVLVVYATWQIWQLLRPYFKTLNAQLGQSVDRIQNPSERESSVSGWLKRSQQFQQQGNYYQACRCLYLAMLQQLHDQGIIPHQASRTDEEYRLLILQLPQPDSYEMLLKVHQQLCFDAQDASPILLVKCQQALREIMNYESRSVANLPSEVGTKQSEL